MKPKGRSLASQRNCFTPGAGPATAAAAAPRSQATSPMLPIARCARRPRAACLQAAAGLYSVGLLMEGAPHDMPKLPRGGSS